MGPTLAGDVFMPRASSRFMTLFGLVTLSCWLSLWPPTAFAMRPDRIAQLRKETVDIFYHGYDNYMRIAFPEDELRPISCSPLVRDSKNPANFEVNDVLGNYSLTLIDSLSSLAIMASAPPDDRDTGPKALADFQNGVQALVEHYGDGRPGASGQGLRSRGFDLDSKVQVFETVIRGVGGLLSAHLFAAGELPIAGYDPDVAEVEPGPLETRPISWPNGLTYDGQLLRLALDLAQRILPAFYTNTGLPYPRVNLRHGIPFYLRSPLHGDGYGKSGAQGPEEITETCSAGAGSLVLEFTVLSRLTGDGRFEQLAKRAFWAVWDRRSDKDLIGAAVDPENGEWRDHYSMLGAGVDSFFEYALKTHILLSGQDLPNRTVHQYETNVGWTDPNMLYEPLSDEQNSAGAFLQTWHHAHAAVKRHLYHDSGHPHYVNVNRATGAPLYHWIDSLGAFYSGVLTLGGELEEAIETNLLYAALWTKYAALPERWSTVRNAIEGGLGWWPGRPEFIESTYYLYRATHDPYYLYVGEMTMRDITRRCWTECGWAGLQDVLTGEKADRMQSFFLGETAKYLFLLYDDQHPLNSLDAPFVFTTEGHPLIIPRRKGADGKRKAMKKDAVESYYDDAFTNTCPVPPKTLPLTGSNTAARLDFFNAARMTSLHQVPNPHGGMEASKSSRQLRPKSNYTFYPWTLPSSMMPCNGSCSKPAQPVEKVLEFPQSTDFSGSALGSLFGLHTLERANSDELHVISVSGLKVRMVLEDIVTDDSAAYQAWRVNMVNGVSMGKDERLVIKHKLVRDVLDPKFSVVKDSVLVHLAYETVTDRLFDSDTDQPEASILSHLWSILRGSPAEPAHADLAAAQNISLVQTAITPIGVGAAPLPPVQDVEFAADEPVPGHGAAPSGFGADADTDDDIDTQPPPPPRHPGQLPPRAPATVNFPWRTVYAAGQACDGALPDAAAHHQVLVMRRGGCTFSDKLSSVPSFAPAAGSPQLVVVVSDDEPWYEWAANSASVAAAAAEGSGGGGARARGGFAADAVDLVRPLLDRPQRTPAGLDRRHLVPMVMVGGGEAAYRNLVRAGRVGLRRRYYVESSGVRVRNVEIRLDD